ncbi:MAG: ATP-binding cassette domain-containing protein [Chloroflexi bacterium]|nr:ATP-binding cassette domain-containing protein [Chloroflexota bacterium]
MSTIELQDITKSFDKSSFGSNLGLNKGVIGEQADRAFAERATTQARAEHEERSAHAGKVTALDHVNLTIPDGQTLAIVGPSGCGKSTLLRVVAGLESDFSGSVLYDGQDMANVPVKDRYIGMVFQNYALYPHFKGHGNLGFFFKMRKIDDKEAEERIRVTAEMMGIGFEALLERKPGTLSGGQQQRVAIARAIVRNPRLFLFDEPLSNLDAKLRTQTRIEIKRLLHRFQITSIYVTHDQVEAIALSDRIAVMRAGKVEQVGEYQSLRDNPATAFVASFLGMPPMNVLAGGVVADGAVRLGAITIPLPQTILAQVHSGQGLKLGVRPEAIQLAAASSTTAHSATGLQPQAAGIHMRGTVDMVEPDFAHQSQLIYVRVGEHAFGVTTELDAAMAGDAVEVVLPTDQLFFFDEQTDQRVT